MTVSFMCNAKPTPFMGPFTEPIKLGFVGHQPISKIFKEERIEYAFQWADGNPEDEDRNGYGVSLKDDKIVKGGSCIIGVATRVDDFDPAIQWVAVTGLVDVVASRIKGDTGTFDNEGVFRTYRKPPKRWSGKVGYRSRTLIEPILSPYMYVGKKTEKNGLCRVLLM